ncbi:MAG: xanthine dehydrogenase molybdopterin binding subunit [Planctomycetota bacterium]|nr:xanthine dehydrogenase molybdopterin binding subunit [Planctomycetota bacterium]
MTQSVGQSVPHDAAIGHVQGNAYYLDDLPKLQGELHVGFVGSPIASGKIVRVDYSKAISLTGVVRCFTVKDVPGHNVFGIVVFDEPFLASEEVLYIGQPIVVIAAESVEAIEQAKKVIEVECIPTQPILSIEESIQHQKFLGPKRRIARGDPAEAIAAATHRLHGLFRSGGQEHLYLEAQAAISYPGEQGQITIHSSTQNPTEIQALVSEMLGVGMHEVVCICKRMGGAFGGKESQAAIPAMMVALVSFHTGRAARVLYDREQDMASTGKRHEYLTDWAVGFEPDGRLVGLKADLYSNGGASTDLSLAVMERSLLHSDNCYFIPNVEVTGQVCFTNIPSNTAFRGFGGPQAIAMIENIMESVAQELGIDALLVRRRNLYGEAPADVTHYGQIFSENKLAQVFDKLEATSNYQLRRDAIREFNKTSKLFVRGLAMTGIKFGISFTTKFLNQGNALVNVYTDGTVQVSTGATEMGQGVNVKIRQVVADEFGIPLSRVVVMATSTEKNNNTSPTAASASMDLNGAAARNACQQIRERMAVFASHRFASGPEGIVASPTHIVFENGEVLDRRRPQDRVAFGPFCAEARRERIDLGARGFFATPGVDFNRETGKGSPFFYYTQGATVAEVEIDRFTGQSRVVRVDLLIDIGDSINPAIDRGQLIGGFIQGMGWVTNECLVYDAKGKLLSNSPTTYKIPAITDLPEVFNVEFFPNHDNQQNIRGSKAVGEPPLMMGVAVWAAMKDAMGSISKLSSSALNLPATGEVLLECIGLGFHEKVSLEDASKTQLEEVVT